MHCEQNDLDLESLLPTPTGAESKRSAMPHLVYAMVGTKPRALFL